MKILVIAGNIGDTAPGIVYETLLQSLKLIYNVSLISPKIKTVPKGIRCLYTYFYENKWPRLEKLIFILTGHMVFQELWSIQQERLIVEDDLKDIDVIVSFASFQSYLGVLLGESLSKKYNKKWIIYSVDAIPAPLGWSENDRHYRNTRKLISKYISKCDAFFSSNFQMLEYQLSAIRSFKKPNGVVYTPIRSDINYNIQKSCTKKLVFLYTGGLYGPRKKDAVLSGFREFLKKYPDAKFVFVGVGKYERFVGFEDLILSGNIEVHGYTSNLDEFYQNATVLLDINAFFDNDVFLSSKIINYLPLNKPIISVTGYNSPSRNIFTDDPSILHCNHDKDSLSTCFEKAITIQVDPVVRNKYISMFKSDEVVKPLIAVIDKI